ncbi:HAMP domain-containing sensor histidine kinase [Nocardia sp. NPDC051756]|uniref:sensor histidine kinase n=1 Tax=Nocardia sp. NPDC051756 TaxID=3154751 RepID=UPI00344754FB
MRVRLVTAFTVLAAICMTCFAIGIGYELAFSRTRGLVIDRIQDANRFGVLAATDPASLNDEAQSYSDRSGNGVLVIAADGTVMCDIRVDRGDAQVRAAVGDGHWIVPTQPLYPWSTQPMFVAQPIGTPPQAGGVVVIDIATAATRTEITDRWIQLVCVTATALLVFGGLALVVSGWILRPVSELLRDVDALTSTLPAQRAAARRSWLRSEGPPEIMELAVGVETVTRAVAELAAAERQLVVDTAHSLRNPLAALAVRLQALQPMIAADRAAATFVSVVGEVDRLTALLDGLLASAVAEAKSDRHAPPVAGCDAVGVAADRVQAWHDAFLRADMTLTLRPLVDAAQTTVPSGVLAQILDVALSNSARYAGRGTQATVTVNHECESVVVAVEDTGVGVSPDEIDRLTTRFFRGAQAGSGGSGLGLPIAATLAAQHGGLFFVDAAQPHGLIVTASLPAAAADSPTLPAGELLKKR